MEASGNGINLNTEPPKFPERGHNRFESLSIDKMKTDGEIRVQFQEEEHE